MKDANQGISREGVLQAVGATSLTALLAAALATRGDADTPKPKAQKAGGLGSGPWNLSLSRTKNPLQKMGSGTALPITGQAQGVFVYLKPPTSVPSGYAYQALYELDPPMYIDDSLNSQEQTQVVNTKIYILICTLA